MELQLSRVELHGVMRGHAGGPAMADEVVGHRAYGVLRAAPQIDAAVAIEVHGPARPAGRHELAQAHGAGVAAARLVRVDAGTVHQAQELLQLALEEGAPLGGARVGVGEVEGQGGQRVDDTVAAHVPAVQGLHADDADDDLGRHAVLRLGARQGLGVVLPEAQAGADAHRLDKARAVGGPVLGAAFGRRQHQARHLAQQPRLADGLAHPFALQAAALGQVVGEAHGIGALGVVLGGGRLGDLLFRVVLGRGAYG